MRGEDADEGLDSVGLDGVGEQGCAAQLHLVLVAGEGGRELRLEEEVEGVAGGGDDGLCGGGSVGFTARVRVAVSGDEGDEELDGAGGADGDVRVVGPELAVLCEDGRAVELDLDAGGVLLHRCCHELEELLDAEGPHAIAHESREEGEGEAHVLEADAGLWRVSGVDGARVALELDEGGVRHVVDGAEGELGVDDAGAPPRDWVEGERDLGVLEEEREAGHGVLEGALLHGDLG